MYEKRSKAELSGNNHGWLDTKHHFSFADYHHPSRMGWGQLRVLNDDTIAPHTGFAAHPHKDMEIITYVRQGAISHRDSLGNFGRTVAGEVQVMTAGTGIVHEERNDEQDTTKIFQIWLMPKEKGLPPRWGSRPFAKGSLNSEEPGGFVQLAALRPQGAETLQLNADGSIWGATINAGQQAIYAAEPSRCIYLVVASGSIEAHGHTLLEGDGLAVHNESQLMVQATETSKLLLIDAAA